MPMDQNIVDYERGALANAKPINFYFRVYWGKRKP